MGYELHITRPEDWTLGDEDPMSDDWSLADENAISREEWEAMARSDDRLIDSGQVDRADDGMTTIYTWRDHEGPSLLWHDGQIDIRGVRSEGEIAEFVELAAGLRAAVQGDDGETYDRSGRPA